MDNSINRRRLLKKGAILALGFPFAGSLLGMVQANSLKFVTVARSHVG